RDDLWDGPGGSVPAGELLRPGCLTRSESGKRGGEEALGVEMEAAAGLVAPAERRDGVPVRAVLVVARRDRAVQRLKAIRRRLAEPPGEVHAAVPDVRPR